MLSKLMKAFKYFGTASITLFFVIVGISVMYNPSFSFWKNAFSDLGSQAANLPNIFNVGLFFVALLMLLFSFSILKASKNKIQTIGGAYLSIASLFIFFIGLFNENTKPHNFIALYFFIQYFIGIITYGLGSVKDKMMFFASSGLFGAFVLVFFISWPSLAMAETYAILLILTFTILTWRVKS
jgi:hypothetical membrane protein